MSCRNGKAWKVDFDLTFVPKRQSSTNTVVQHQDVDLEHPATNCRRGEDDVLHGEDFPDAAFVHSYLYTTSFPRSMCSNVAGRGPHSASARYIARSNLIGISIQRSRLILDRHILARRTLILSSNEIRNLLVLGLLDGGFVVLLALAEEALLDVVDSWRMRRRSGQ